MKIFSHVYLNGNRLTGLPDMPQTGSEATSLTYVLSLFGLTPQNSFSPVRVASEVNVPLSAAGISALIDGVTILPGERVLLSAQTNPAQNGIYQLALTEGGTSYILNRTQDADTPGQLTGGKKVFVIAGSNAGTAWAHTSSILPMVIGTSPIQFTQTELSSSGAKKEYVEIVSNGVSTEIEVDLQAVTMNMIRISQLKWNGAIVYADISDVGVSDGSGGTIWDWSKLKINLGNPIPNGERLHLIVIG